MSFSLKSLESLITSLKLENLDFQEIEVVQRDSHELWSGGASLEARILKIEALLNYPDRPIRYIGLKSQQGVHCSAKLYECDAQLGDTSIRLLGLGALFTPSDQRGKGYASKLINEVINLARVGGYQGVYLWSDIGIDFYRGFGFQEIAIRQFSMQASHSEELLKDVVVSPTQVDDFKELSELYRQATKDFDFKLIRKNNRWNFWRLLNRSVDFKVTHKNQFVGYFTAAQESPNDYYWLEEAFATPGHEALVLNAISDRAAYHGKKVIKGWSYLRVLLKDAILKDSPIPKPIPMVKFFSEREHQKLLNCKKHYLSSVDHF